MTHAESEPSEEDFDRLIAGVLVQIHGCHPYYAHDLSGWHRHEKGCALPGFTGGKNRSAVRD